MAEPVIGGDGDPDAGAHPDGHPVERDGVEQRLGQLLGHHHQFLAGGDDAGAGELVASEPGHRAPVAHLALEPSGHDAQELVTAVVPEGVVDLLEPVEVDEHHAHVFGLVGRVQFHLRVLHEGAAVLEGGELIGPGVTEVVGPPAQFPQGQGHADDHHPEGGQGHVRGHRGLVVTERQRPAGPATGSRRRWAPGRSRPGPPVTGAGATSAGPRDPRRRCPGARWR